MSLAPSNCCTRKLILAGNSRSRIRRLCLSAAIVCVSVFLVSCSSGVSFSPAETDIPLCTGKGPYDLVSLSQDDRPACDVAGEKLVFPNGFEITAPALLHTRESYLSTSPNKYFATNFAIYGMVAAVREGDGQITWFGNADAVQKYHDEVGYDF